MPVLVLPDGMPTVWIAWWKQLYHVDRVFGPDLMLGVIEESQKSGERHFLLGGNPGSSRGIGETVCNRVFPQPVSLEHTPRHFAGSIPSEEADLAVTPRRTSP